jgi:hypothetical protein
MIEKYDKLSKDADIRTEKAKSRINPDIIENKTVSSLDSDNYNPAYRPIIKNKIK